MTRVLLMLTIVFSGTFAEAATPKTALAPAPSLDVFGLHMGAAFSLPECPTTPPAGGFPASYATQTTFDCWKTGLYPKAGTTIPADEITISFGKPLALGFLQWAKATVIDGKLESLDLRTNGNSAQDFVLKTLKEKYGEPSSLNQASPQNSLGAKFPSVDAYWKFSNLSVIFDGIVTSIDQGWVFIDTPTGAAWKKAENDKKESQLRKM